LVDPRRDMCESTRIQKKILGQHLRSQRQKTQINGNTPGARDKECAAVRSGIAMCRWLQVGMCIAELQSRDCGVGGLPPTGMGER